MSLNFRYLITYKELDVTIFLRRNKLFHYRKILLSGGLLSVSKLTKLLEHLVALVKDEVLDVLQVQFLALDEGQQTTC